MSVIRGTSCWADAYAYHSQENNPTEAYNKARLASHASYWLETCGPTSAVNCLAAMGKRLLIICPGVYSPQPEEVLMDYMNDPRNGEKLRKVRDLGDLNIPENQVPQYYPLAVYEVFRVRGRFEWGAKWDQVTKELDRMRAVQICLKSPSHYIAVVAYDQSKKELIYHDSWGARFGDGKGGFARRMTESELNTNVQPYRITYGV